MDFNIGFIGRKTENLFSFFPVQKEKLKILCEIQKKIFFKFNWNEFNWNTVQVGEIRIEIGWMKYRWENEIGCLGLKSTT